MFIEQTHLDAYDWRRDPRIRICLIFYAKTTGRTRSHARTRVGHRRHHFSSLMYSSRRGATSRQRSSRKYYRNSSRYKLRRESQSLRLKFIRRGKTAPEYNLIISSPAEDLNPAHGTKVFRSYICRRVNHVSCISRDIYIYVCVQYIVRM